MSDIHKVNTASKRRQLGIAVLWAMLLAILTLAACGTIPAATPAPVVVVILNTPVGISDQATLAAVLTQVQNNSDFQAAATAAIVQANAQATLDSANATLSAAQIQAQNITNIIAAQVAATAVVVRANARATLVAAGATQRAALTQDAIRQTQTQYIVQVTQAAGTQSAGAILLQQYKNDLASGTQTAVANNIATQTQVAVATSQWYTDQSRQRQEQIRGSIGFLWKWALPIFIVLLAGLLVWGFWRWLRIKQDNQRILEIPADRLPGPIGQPNHHLLNDSSSHPENTIIESHYRLTRPVDQARLWLDEVKRKLVRGDEKDEDDKSDE
jgi:hypothetical protein